MTGDKAYRSRVADGTGRAQRARVIEVADTTGARDAILVPFGSVGYAVDGSAQGWAVAADRTIQPRAVTLGRAIGDRVVVETGLAAGESFVARAEPTLKTGQSLSTQVPQPPQAAPAGGDGHDHEH